MLLGAGAGLIGAAGRAPRPPRSSGWLLLRLAGLAGWLSVSPVTDSDQQGSKRVKDGAGEAGQPALNPHAAVLCLGPCCNCRDAANRPHAGDRAAQTRLQSLQRGRRSGSARRGGAGRPPGGAAGTDSPPSTARCRWRQGPGSSKTRAVGRFTFGFVRLGLVPCRGWLRALCTNTRRVPPGPLPPPPAHCRYFGCHSNGKQLHIQAIHPVVCADFSLAFHMSMPTIGLLHCRTCAASCAGHDPHVHVAMRGRELCSTAQLPCNYQGMVHCVVRSPGQLPTCMAATAAAHASAAASNAASSAAAAQAARPAAPLGGAGCAGGTPVGALSLRGSSTVSMTCTRPPAAGRSASVTRAAGRPAASCRYSWPSWRMACKAGGGESTQQVLTRGSAGLGCGKSRHTQAQVWIARLQQRGHCMVQTVRGMQQHGCNPGMQLRGFHAKQRHVSYAFGLFVPISTRLRRLTGNSP